MNSTFGALTVLMATVLLAPHLSTAQDRTTAGRIDIGPNHPASRGDEAPRHEGWIAASSTDSKILVGVYKDGHEGCGTTVSTDGGNLWNETALAKATECFDPMVIAGDSGVLYVLHTGTKVGATTSQTGQVQDRPIRIFSTKDGKTWRGPTELRTPVHPDHPRMAVDRSTSTRRGRLYVVWNEVSDIIMKDQYHLFLQYSDDGGATFSEPTVIATHAGGKLVATEPVVLSDGTLLVTYYQYFLPYTSASAAENEHQPFFVLRSADGGRTFEAPDKVFEIGMATWPQLLGYTTAFTLPIVSADISARSLYRDRIYVVWTDVTAGESNVWLRWSQDNGKTWASKIRVNDDVEQRYASPPDLRLIPVAAVNKDGVVGVAWYDRRDDPARRCWKIYFSASIDGGRTFGSNTVVSSAPSCPTKISAPRVCIVNGARSQAASVSAATTDSVADVRVEFAGRGQEAVGDYMGLTGDAGNAFHAFWVDMRNGFRQFYSARIGLPTLPERPALTLHEADVTALVELRAATPHFDETTETTSVDLTLRNVSSDTIYGPVKVRVKRVLAGGAGPIVDSENRKSGAGAEWDFSGLLGTRGRLTPGLVSEPHTVRIRSRQAEGLDVRFEFEVRGRLKPNGPRSPR
jgi:hypothetical protein